MAYFLILITSIFLYPGRLSTFNKEYIFIITIIYIGVLVYFLYQQSKFTKNWLRFDVLFLLGYTIVHFQIPFLASIGIEPERPNMIWINKDLVNYASWMSLVAINLWMIGYTLKLKQNFSKLVINSKIFKVNYRIYDIVLLLSFLAFIGTVGSGFLIYGTYNGGKNWGLGSNYANMILRVLIYLRIAYFFKDLPHSISVLSILKKAYSQKLFFIVIVLYTLLFLRTGDRGPVMGIALAIGAMYILYIKPIPLSKLLIFVIVGAFVFTIIKFGRGNDESNLGNGNIIERGFTNFNKEEDQSNLTDELASSVRIQYRALDIVPEKHPYLMGLSFYTQAVGFIPFISVFNTSILGIPIIYGASSTLLNTIAKGPDYASGDGTEILADIYINFGIYGTFIVMFLFGNFTAQVYRKAMLNQFSYILILMVLIYSSIYMNRAMLLTPMKDIMYILFINYLFRKVIK